mgnify:CR=1 FL=1
MTFTFSLFYLHALLVLGFVYTISESVIFMPVRRLAVALCPKFALPLLIALLYCTRCLGFWVGAAVGFALTKNFVHAALFGVLGIAEMHIAYSYFIQQHTDPWLKEPTEKRDDGPQS